jgi:c-di-GMP-binding flagellar brake protein YcgR
MLAAQKLTLKPGETARRALRVSRALQLDLETGGTSQRTVTLDISTGGFAALMAMPPAMGDLLEVTLRLPGAEKLTCRARIVEVKPLTGSTRVAARFVDLSKSSLERLEFLIIDSVLAMFQG